MAFMILIRQDCSQIYKVPNSLKIEAILREIFYLVNIQILKNLKEI